MRSLLFTFGLIALLLPAALAGLFGVLQHIDAINREVASVRNAQVFIASLLRRQLDEELDVREIVRSRAPASRARYARDVTFFAANVRNLRAELTRVTPPPIVADADEIARINAGWARTVAAPAIAGARVEDTSASTAEIRRVRTLARAIDAGLVTVYAAVLRERTRTLAGAGLIGYGAIGVTAIEGVIFAALFARLRRTLDRERGVVEALQTAFSGAMTTVEGLDVATAYVSATRGATVGGDVFDVYRIDANVSLLLIADVSGKGVEAAVDTTFVKYSMRAFTAGESDIGVAVSRFNALYANAQKPREAFIVLFAAYFDRRTGALSYVNAGHEAAYVCRPDGVELLAPTAPIVGLFADGAFAAARTKLGPDETLFLATDGLTEARDPSGAFLGEARLREWLASACAEPPPRIVAEISERLRRYTGANVTDDLAILAVRPQTIS